MRSSLFSNSYRNQGPSKVVFVDIEDEYREDEETYNRIINTTSRLKWGLYIIFVFGIIATVPWIGMDKPFLPEFLILVYLPVSVYILSKLYINRVKNGFQLVRRLHEPKAIEEDNFDVYLELKYKSIFPFSIAYVSDEFKGCKNLASPIKILNNSEFDTEGTLNLKYTVPLNRGYGKFMVGPLTLNVHDPFMFFNEKLILKPKQDTYVNVWLNPPPEEDMDLINSTVLEPQGSTRSSKAGNGMDFYGIKEYAQGDDVRAICWTKSASIGKTVIKQFEKDCMSTVFLAVHTDRTQLRGLGFGNGMNRIFRICAAVIQETRNRGIPVKLAMTQDKTTNIFSVNSNVPAYGFMTDILNSFDKGKLSAAEPEAAESLMDTICAEAGPGSIVLLLSHTLRLDYDVIFDGISALHSRGVKIILWVIDDSKLLNFTGAQQKEKITPQEFADKVEELGIEFRIINPKDQYAKEEAYKEAGRLMKE